MPTLQDEILARHVIILFQNNANITLFQHDNARSHTARDNVNFFRAENIAFVNDWPAKSPDLSAIEHLWDNLDQHVRHRPVPLSNIIQLRRALIQEWNNIPQAICTNDARQSFMLKVVILHFNYHFTTFG